MKDSVKANLIVFAIIAIISFSASSAFASLTIHKENDSYKMIAIENDSFEPNYIEEVPTVMPKIENNTTANVTADNTTDSNIIDQYINSTGNIIEETIEEINDTYNNWTNSNKTN